MKLSHLALALVALDAALSIRSGGPSPILGLPFNRWFVSVAGRPISLAPDNNPEAFQ